MKLVRDNRSVIQSDYNMESVSFGIRTEDSPIIMEMLRSKIYSNKPAAVVREYTTNALDEHKFHNIDEPVIITMPTHTNPEFKVRDFGQGLSKDQIQEVYVNYGCSTKRNSDDLTGGLGIGCKAAFAYGSQFTITSWWRENGNVMKAVYAAIIDESHSGTLKVMQKPHVVQDTKTGIEIGVGVKSDDMSRFKREIWNLYQTCESKPLIENWNHDEDDQEPEILDEKENYTRYKRDGSWSTFNKYNSAVAVMGNIGYPINTDQLSGLSTAQANMLRDRALHIRFNIGELSISTNREELEYNTQTCNHLSSRAQELVDEIVNSTTELICGKGTTDCFFDMQKRYAELTTDMDASLIRLLNVPPKLTDTTLSLKDNMDFIHYEYRYHGGSKKLFTDNDRSYVRWGPATWRHSSLVIAFYDDNIPQAQVTRRVKGFMLERVNHEDTQVIAIPKSASTTVDDALSNCGLPKISSDYAINLMDYEPLAAIAKVKTGNSTAHVELFKYNVKDNYNMQSRAWVDAGKVSIASTDTVLFMYLSGHNAILPSAKDKKTVDYVDKIDLEKLKRIIVCVNEHSDLLTDDEAKEISHYLNADKRLDFAKVPLYGARKKHYKTLDNLTNAICLYDLATELVKRAIRRAHKHSHTLDDEYKCDLAFHKKYYDPESLKQDEYTRNHISMLSDSNRSWRRDRTSRYHNLLYYSDNLLGNLSKQVADAYSKIPARKLAMLNKLRRINKALYHNSCMNLRNQAKMLGLYDLCKRDATIVSNSKEVLFKNDQDILNVLAYFNKNYPLLNEFCSGLPIDHQDMSAQDRIINGYFEHMSYNLSDEDHKINEANQKAIRDAEHLQVYLHVVRYLSN